MTRPFACLLVALGLLVGCDDDPAGTDAGAPTADAGGALDAGPPADDAGPPADDDAGPPADDDAGPPTGGGLDTFEDTVAAAQCAAIFRCCAAGDLEDVFADYRSIPGLPSPFDALQDRIPPTEDTCVDLMRDLNAIAPFGQWLVEARAGRVGFDEAAYDACLEDLATAECGRPLELALDDTDCFALRSSAGPSPGARAVNRAFFVRPATEGDACTMLEEDDSLAGTCDPTDSFCCDRASPDADCMPVSVGGAGTCVPFAGDGEECREFPPLPCGEGLRCAPGASISDPSLCEPAPSGTAALGETCTEGFVPVAECAEGYCDASTDPGVCAARRADGEACDVADQCASFHCAGDLGARTCQPFALCTEGA